MHVHVILPLSGEGASHILQRMREMQQVEHSDTPALRILSQDPNRFLLFDPNDNQTLYTILPNNDTNHMQFVADKWEEMLQLVQRRSRTGRKRSRTMAALKLVAEQQHHPRSLQDVARDNVQDSLHFVGYNDDHTAVVNRLFYELQPQSGYMVLCAIRVLSPVNIGAKVQGRLQGRHPTIEEGLFGWPRLPLGNRKGDSPGVHGNRRYELFHSETGDGRVSELGTVHGATEGGH